MTIECAACHVTCNMCIMQALYSEHVHIYILLGVIHVSTVAIVKLISRTNTTKEFGDYTLDMITCITVCLHQHHAHRGFTDSPAGIVKRSPSSIVLEIGITVSFIHQISDYIEISLPGVKQYTLSLWQLYTVSSRSLCFCESHEGHRGTHTDTLIRTIIRMYLHAHIYIVRKYKAHWITI